MKTRMKNPGAILPGAGQGVQALIESVQKAGVPSPVFHLVHLRASQINGCAYCVDSAIKQARQEGETDDRLHAVAAWREMSVFSDKERAAFALTEEMTRLNARDAVPDTIWEMAASRYDERQLGGLVLWIAVVNMFNRVNVAIRQTVG